MCNLEALLVLSESFTCHAEQSEASPSKVTSLTLYARPFAKPAQGDRTCPFVMLKIPYRATRVACARAELVMLSKAKHPPPRSRALLCMRDPSLRSG